MHPPCLPTHLQVQRAQRGGTRGAACPAGGGGRGVVAAGGDGQLGDGAGAGDEPGQEAFGSLLVGWVGGVEGGLGAAAASVQLQGS